MDDAARPAWAQLPAARGDAGALLHLARAAAGLTLVEAGDLVGYSAATLSRMETGRRQLTDVQTLRRLAATFAIPADMLGLTTAPAVQHTEGPAIASLVGTAAAAAQEESDPMRRRELLVGLATGPLLAAAASAAAGSPAGAAPATHSLQQALTAVLLHPAPPHPGPVTPEDPAGGDIAPQVLTRELATCMTAFQASRYDVLTLRLPALVTRIDTLPAAQLPQVRAEVYNAVAKVLIKLETPGLGWVATDRALQAARISGDPAVLASCTRSAVSLCRRDGQYASAQTLALQACADLTVTGPQPDPGHLSLYGMLLCNAGYAAAQAGDRPRSRELLDLAEEASRRVGRDRNEHWTAFGPANVTLHRISAAFALGDAGIAIDHAQTINPADLRLPERRSRYWVDVARAYHQWGRPERCYEALSIAERQAPDEVRARPVVHSLTRELLTSSAPLPGLRTLAHRVGALS